MPSSRAHRTYKEFEAAIDRVIGDRIRSDGAFAVDLWSALANVEWRGPEGRSVSYSFRRAGEVVVWIREEGDYLDWYCCTEPGIVADWISDALAAEGWSWTIPNG